MEQMDKKLYQCPECGLHYENEADVKLCEEWRRTHHSCNLEITAKAVENRAGFKL